ncbi:hypothetical protein F2Q69_00009614 [Brassica cretica]|uniref:CBS domain-containing protein n=1 Tax=Brassica cretica TaxID=69181 RepID=A0A8S9PIZ2_BRACR|nr:hypothetical protein F2Q69_00009614 [Brassica cretica]
MQLTTDDLLQTAQTEERGMLDRKDKSSETRRQVAMAVVAVNFPDLKNIEFVTFNELQKLISKTHGQVVGDLMTPSPLVVRGSTNLEDAARLLLETKFRRLPVVDSDGKLIGILTRGNVVRAALQIKRETEKSA